MDAPVDNRHNRAYNLDRMRIEREDDIKDYTLHY